MSKMATVPPSVSTARRPLTSAREKRRVASGVQRVQWSHVVPEADCITTEDDDGVPSMQGNLGLTSHCVRVAPAHQCMNHRIVIHRDVRVHFPPATSNLDVAGHMDRTHGCGSDRAAVVAPMEGLDATFHGQGRRRQVLRPVQCSSAPWRKKMPSWPAMATRSCRKATAGPTHRPDTPPTATEHSCRYRVAHQNRPQRLHKAPTKPGAPCHVSP